LKPSTAEANNHELELVAVDHELLRPSTVNCSLKPSTAEAMSWSVDHELLKPSTMSF
jgi:hypothetical protein